MSKDNLQFTLILGLFGYLIFLQQCKGPSNSPGVEQVRDTIVTIDTIFPAPIIVQMPRQVVPAPQIIYIDSSKNIVLDTDIDTSKHIAARVYKDSLEDENLTLYYSSIVDGQLLQNNLDYKLKIPTQITKTIEIPKPYPKPVNALFLNGGIGGNVHQFSSITVGLQFVSKKGWALGYDYDVLQNVHSVKMGLKLFSFAKKKNPY